MENARDIWVMVDPHTEPGKYGFSVCEASALAALLSADWARRTAWDCQTQIREQPVIVHIQYPDNPPSKKIRGSIETYAIKIVGEIIRLKTPQRIEQ